MALVPPRLDDRTWDDLRRELVRRIPVHAPGWTWTDHNPSDPGVALLELFAWLGENLLRRMDRVPDAAHLEFLRLLAVPLRPAACAWTFLRFDLPKGRTEPVVIVAAPGKPRTVASAGKVPFQVLGEVDVLPVECLGALKLALDEAPADVDAEALAGLVTGTPAFYETRRVEAPQGAVIDAVSLADAVDDTLWVAVLCPEAVLKSLTVEEARLALANRVLSVGVGIDESLSGPEESLQCPRPGEPATGPAVRWEISTGTWASGLAGRITGIQYDRLTLVEDGTRGLARPGVVRLQLPVAESGAVRMGTWTVEDSEGQSYAGVGEMPPTFDDPKLDDRVLFWLRARREDPSIAAPSVTWVDVNLAVAEQAVTARPEVLGTGTGAPDQVVKLARTPVLADSLLVEVLEQGAGWVTWQRVEDLAASGAADPHYTLDAPSGEVRFGDGVHGRFPRLGEAIRSRTYRYGGGAAGNVGAGQVTRVTETDRESGAGSLKVTNPLPAVGGRDGETVEEARTRIPEVIRHQDRAVAMDDFRAIALETPAVHIARAHVLPRRLPRDPDTEAAGVVTLVVVPAWDPKNPSEPMPDRAALRAVCAHLEPRRLVTTELYVAPPEYVPIWISVAVSLQEGYGVQTVQRWVDLALRQHFAPLPPYGPAGEGWPFGRMVRLEDVQAAALQVEGVELVRDARVKATPIAVEGPQAAITFGAKWRAGDAEEAAVELLPWQLPVIRGVLVGVGETAEEPEVGTPVSGSEETERGVPIPTVRETC